MDEALGMVPAKGVPTDAELAGVVGKYDGALQQALMADRAPQGAFGRDHGRIEAPFHLMQPNASRQFSHASLESNTRCFISVNLAIVTSPSARSFMYSSAA